MAELIKSAALLLLTPQCFDQYFVNFNFFHGECMKATLSKVLGLAIVAGSATVKVPQILKIVNNQSGEGLSLLGTSLDLTAITSVFLYCFLQKYPFSAYGDGLFLVIQTAIIFALILYYQGRITEVALFVAVYLSILYVVITGILPMSVLIFLQVLNLPIIIMGKGAQALSNFKAKSTGQISAATCWMQFGGAAIRVFTSVQDTGDFVMILTYIICSAFHGLILFQLYYYATSTAKKEKEKAKSKGKKAE